MSDFRSKASLPVSVSLHEPPGHAGSQSAVLKGQTRDLRATGLSLVLPTLNLGGHHLADAHHTLKIALELPDATIEMLAVAVRYEELEEEAGERHLVGVRITEVSDEDCVRFIKFLRSLH
jgi:hypothetical protein